MKKNIWLTVLIVLILTFALVTIGDAMRQDDLAEVRRSTARFHRTEVAQAAGWDLVPGLDHCFDNPGVGGMGFHYINTDLLDTELDPVQPEALVYDPGPNGRLKLVAVEYIVPAEEWDAAGHSQLPELFGRTFHLNDALGVYVLHAWIWLNNPAGLFEDWNPNLSCPPS